MAITTITNFQGNDLEGNFSALFTPYNPYEYTYKLRLSIPNVYALQTTTNYFSGYVTLSSSSLNYIKNYMSNNGISKVKIGAVIEVWVGSTKIGESAEVINKCSFSDANPTWTASNITYADTDSSVTAITTNNQHIVNGKSNLKVTFTAATAKKGASISSYSFTLNGDTRTASSAGNINFGVINATNDLTLTATVTDDRGNTTTVTKTITVLDYSVPTATVTLNRLNNYEDTTYLTVDGSIASVNSKNVMTIQYKYKQNGGSYGSLVTIQDNVRQTLTLDKNYEFIFYVIVTDSFGETFTKEYLLTKGYFPLFIDTAMNAVSINEFPSSGEAFHVAGGTSNLKGGGTIGKQYASDVLSFALSCPDGLTPFYVDADTQNIPDSGFTYSSGIVEKRDSTHVSVMMYGHSNSKIALNTHRTSSWEGWNVFSGSKVLYSNDSGTTGTVTLSETAANFSFLDITIKNDVSGTNTYESMRIYNPNGKYISNTRCGTAGTLAQLTWTTWKVNGTQMTNIGESFVNFNQSASTVQFGAASTKHNYITQVIGWR